VGGETLLIAAFSGRALAQSARRAGFEPLVVDCFGDCDTLEAAGAHRCLDASLQTGFEGARLLAALDELAAGARAAPIGLVLGAGFEGTPKLMARLAERFNVIGNSTSVVERTKSPVTFFAGLERLGIRHPQTLTEPPERPGGWLMKRTGGSGGLHIAPCPPDAKAGRRRYFQERIEGEAISALAMLGPASVAFAFSRQWTSPSGKHPYRFGGAVGSIALSEDLEARLVDIALAVAAEMSLAGLVSFDFLVAKDEPVLIEVNPRPGATLDVFDDGQGTLIQAHIEGCRQGGDPAAILNSQWAPPIARAVAYLYADKGAIRAPGIDWPPWTADRPRAGTLIPRHQPLATVLAEGATAESAEALCRRRLEEIETMLYQSHGKDSDPCPSA
jgi:predicted ATP-grasp superfamily ATP-dependent carboligase